MYSKAAASCTWSSEVSPHRLEYSGLVQGICGTVSGIYAANEICKSVNRVESIIWVKWDNGVELGLIEGIDKYELL